jgi:hypothetical protein
MLFGRNDSVDQLKFVAETHQVGFPSGMFQELVVITPAVSYAVAGEVKGNTRNNYQVCFVGLVFDSGRAWLQNAEGSFLQSVQSQNLPEYHLFAAKCRIKNPLPGFEGVLQYPGSINLFMYSGIQRNARSPGILRKGKQITLR